MSPPSASARLPLDRPLQPIETLVLSVLHDAPLHGYGLVGEIAERTAGAVSVRPGNLYRVLDRLVDAGLVAESEPPAGAAANGHRGAERTRHFAITELGRERVRFEAETLGRALGASPALRRAVRKGMGSA